MIRIIILYHPSKRFRRRSFSSKYKPFIQFLTHGRGAKCKCFKDFFSNNNQGFQGRVRGDLFDILEEKVHQKVCECFVVIQIWIGILEDKFDLDGAYTIANLSFFLKKETGLVCLFFFKEGGSSPFINHEFLHVVQSIHKPWVFACFFWVVVPFQKEGVVFWPAF